MNAERNGLGNKLVCYECQGEFDIIVNVCHQCHTAFEQLQAEMQDYIGVANTALCFVDLKPEHKLYESIRQDLKGYLVKLKGGKK